MKRAKSVPAVEALTLKLLQESRVACSAVVQQLKEADARAAALRPQPWRKLVASQGPSGRAWAVEAAAVAATQRIGERMTNKVENMRIKPRVAVRTPFMDFHDTQLCRRLAQNSCERLCWFGSKDSVCVEAVGATSRLLKSRTRPIRHMSAGS